MPKDINASSDFNGENILPKKSEQRFKKLILRHGQLFENFISDDVHNAHHDKLYQFFRFSNIHGVASRHFEDTKVLQARHDLGDMSERQHKLCDDMIDIIYDSMIDFFSGLSINESMILSQRARKERVKKIHQGQAEPFRDISLKPYVSHFIRWLCHSELPHHRYVASVVSWPPEDWNSDAISIIRGYLISKNKNHGKAQFRLEDFDHVYDQSHLGEPKIDKGIKPIAAEFIPAEGLDFVRLALSTMPAIEQFELPNIWREDEFSPVSMPADIIDIPDVDILHADQHYILMHLKNESAAKSFGSNPAWCVTYGHWDTYSDNFLFICDADGYRYGIHLRENQCVDQNDLPVDLENLFERFDGLKDYIQEFYNKQLKSAIKKNHVGNTLEVIIPIGFQNSTTRRQMSNADFVHCSYDTNGIRFLFTDLLRPEEISTVFNELINFYENTPKRKQHFIDENITDILFDLHQQSKITTVQLFEYTTHARCVFGQKLKDKMSQSWRDYLETESGQIIKCERPSFKP